MCSCIPVAVLQTQSCTGSTVLNLAVNFVTAGRDNNNHNCTAPAMVSYTSTYASCCEQLAHEDCIVHAVVHVLPLSKVFHCVAIHHHGHYRLRVTCLFSGGAQSRPKAVAGKAALLSRMQSTQSQPSSKNAADRVTKRLVHSARSGARQGSSGDPALGSSAPAAAAAASSSASDAAASALKQASVSGRLGCPKCRQAVYGCKKCRAAYVRTTGIAIPIDRSLHADVFSMLQHPPASSHTAAKSSHLVPSQKPSSAGLVKGDMKGKAVCTGKGKAASAAMPKGQKGVADGHRLPAQGQKLSADRKTLSADRRGSAKLTEATGQQPARKKQKVATPAAADTGAKISNRAASYSKRPPPDSTPDVRKAHADSAPPAAKRSRLSQTPKAPATAQAPESCHSTAVKGSSSMLSTAGRAAAASGKPGSNAKSANRAAKPSSFSARTSSATAKQLSKAVRASAPAAAARSVAAPIAAGTPHADALPKQAALASKQDGKPTSVPPKSNTKGSDPAQKALSSSPAPALPPQAAARARSVAAPKAMPAAKLRQTPSSRAAVAAGSLLVQGLDSNLGCSKCRFVPTGCKRCKAKQAGQQQQFGS